MFQLKWTNIQEKGVTNLIIPVSEDRNISDDPAISELVKKAKNFPEFKGGKGDELVFYDPKGFNIKRVLFMGIGKQKNLNFETLRTFAGKSIKKCIKMGLKEALVQVPSVKGLQWEMEAMLKPLVEGAFLGNHLFDKYKQKKKYQPLGRIAFFVPRGSAKRHSRFVSKVCQVCEGTLLAREWVSTPSNEKKPEKFAKSIITQAKKAKLKTFLFDEKALKQKRFGALLSVSAGSRSQAQLVVLEHRPKGAKQTIALVGKGVTFDSGGINLKPSAGMDEMKMDMSGGAVVAGTLIAAARLNLKVGLIGIIPIVENMPSGTASRPGDIVRSYEGKTVEIGNTDAEGRLILIDAIAYAVKKYHPDTIIDLATLTGACVVALGEKIAGLFTSDEDLAKTIIDSGEKTYERCWHMPMPEDYKEHLKSDFADIRNIGSTRWGGAITAALFLSEFVGRTRWAHIDIAGPAYIKKESDYCGAGGTGFGVRLLTDVIENL